MSLGFKGLYGDLIYHQNRKQECLNLSKELISLSYTNKYLTYTKQMHNSKGVNVFQYNNVFGK